MRILKYFYIALLAFVLGACSDFFDKVPQDSLTNSQIDGSKIEKLRNGVYQQTGGLDFMLDGYADNGFSRNVWDSNGGIVQKGIINATTDIAYTSNYGGIRVCNNFLKFVEAKKNKVDADTKAKLPIYKAEARMIRAWAYAELTLYYGDCVKVDGLVNTFGKEGRPRLSAKEIRTWALSEFDAAIKDLPVKGKEDGVGRYNKMIATALKARYAYYFGEYKQAEDAAKDVIDNGGYELLGVANAQKYEGLDDDNKFFEQLVDFNTLNINKAKFLQGIKNYWSIWHTERAANTETILASYNKKSSDYADGGRFYVLLPPDLTTQQGWATMVPIQPLVNAYWTADGKKYTPNSYETIKKDYKELDNKVKAITGDAGDENETLEGMSKDGTLAKDPFISNFRNRDARLYASILFPFSSAKSFLKGKYYIYNEINNNYGYSGYTFRKIAPSERYDNPFLNGGYASSPIDLPVIRLGEMLLIYAEAHTQVTGYDASVETELNKLRDRVGMPHVKSGLTKNDALEMIRTERRIELANEGLRYFDIRLYQDDTRNGGYKGDNAASVVMKNKLYKDIADKNPSVSLTWSDHLMLMPIPTSVMIRNKALKQNAGY